MRHLDFGLVLGGTTILLLIVVWLLPDPDFTLSLSQWLSLGHNFDSWLGILDITTNRVMLLPLSDDLVFLVPTHILVESFFLLLFFLLKHKIESSLGVFMELLCPCYGLLKNSRHFLAFFRQF